MTEEAKRLIIQVVVSPEMSDAIDQRAYEESGPGEQISRPELVRRALRMYLRLEDASR